MEPPAGWYADPGGAPGYRYWDGRAWGALALPPAPVAPVAPASSAPRRWLIGGGLGVAALITIGVAAGVGTNVIHAMRNANRPVVGTCVEVPPSVGGGVRALFPERACTSPHNGEVVSVGRFTESAYPGEEAIRTEALNLCSIAVRQYVGDDATLLHSVATFPRADQWALGTRDYVCYAVDRNEEISTSVRPGG